MKKVDLWKREDLSKQYLEVVRAGIPLAKTQMEVLLALIGRMRKKVTNFLDLGCGDGVLGWAMLSKYPKAHGVFLDFSKAMIESAQEKAPKGRKGLVFIREDYGKPAWCRAVSGYGKFDLVISGFSIHHQPDKRKKELYREIFKLLEPGGLFLNLEHVSSATPKLKNVFDDYFVDSLYEHLRRLDQKLTRREVGKKYYDNQLRDANILAPVEKQCRWLRTIGFKDVDCYFKIFELALFGGMKPY
jgi:ubiquinone/menaquinone biosynthesis C-methylase UbiE